MLQDVHGQVLERGVAAFVEAEQVGNEAHDLRLEVDKEILNNTLYSAGGRDGRSCLIKGRCSICLGIMAVMAIMAAQWIRTRLLYGRSWSESEHLHFFRIYMHMSTISLAMREAIARKILVKLIGRK